MVVTVIGILVIGACLVTIASAMGKAPLWIAVFFLSLVELLRLVPLGR